MRKHIFKQSMIGGNRLLVDLNQQQDGKAWNFSNF